MKGPIEFAKYTGAGNDFILIDNRSGVFPADSELIREMCTRRTSIGADGLILLEPSAKADIRMRSFNSDGGEAEMCGNGARCLVAFARRKGLDKTAITLETMERVLTARVDGETISLEMGEVTETQLDIDIEIDGQIYHVHHTNTGVPHAVMFVENVEGVEVVSLGRKVRFHSRFQPKGANANFVQVTGENTIFARSSARVPACILTQGRRDACATISARTYERGVEDETLACGTGCAACAVISSLVKGLTPPIRVQTRGGTVLTVDFKKKRDDISQLTVSGPARLVYEGVYYP